MCLRVDFRRLTGEAVWLRCASSLPPLAGYLILNATFWRLPPAGARPRAHSHALSGQSDPRACRLSIAIVGADRPCGDERRAGTATPAKQLLRFDFRWRRKSVAGVASVAAGATGYNPAYIDKGQRPASKISLTGGPFGCPGRSRDPAGWRRVQRRRFCACAAARNCKMMEISAALRFFIQSRRVDA